MNLARFQEIVGAYGAEPGRWPADERADAQALLAASADARLLIDDAKRLDSVLEKATTSFVSAQLTERVLRTAPSGSGSSGQDRPSWLAELWPGAPIWRPAVALAASMMLGLAVGAFAPVFPDPNDTVMDDEGATFGLDVDDIGWDG